MGDTILLVLEGGRAEPKFLTELFKFYIKKNDRSHVIKVIYGTVMYRLHKELKADDDIGLLELLVEAGKLENSDISSISHTYLIFDHDPHVSNYSEEIVKSMLNIFDNPTDNGLLIISYPMVEAIKNIKRSVLFKNATYSIENESLKKYKNHVAKHEVKNGEKLYINSDFISPMHYSENDWKYIIEKNISKANFICNGDDSLPVEIISQNAIFNAQLEKFIKPRNEISILSSLPFLVQDYYGARIIHDYLKNQKEL